jgi:hypothetical protein
MSDYEVIKNTLAATIAEELEWVGYGHVAGQKPDPIHNQWLPYQMADFISLLAECVAVSEGDHFLDVRSGIGTKLAVARDLFGLSSMGLEREKELFKYAHDSGRATILSGALEANPEHFWVADIIWLYRPYRDSLAQAKLEHKIYEEMKTGAIIAGAGFEQPPGGFEIVVDNWEDGLASAWKKPANWEPVIYDLNEDE